MNDLTIGALAKLCQVSIDTIRYYEKRDLISTKIRSVSGYRLFNNEHLKQVLFIKKAQRLGFRLSEIKSLLSLNNSSENDCNNIHDQVAFKIDEIDLKIAQLKEIREALTCVAKTCSQSNKHFDKCTILTFLYEEENADG